MTAVDNLRKGKSFGHELYGEYPASIEGMSVIQAYSRLARNYFRGDRPGREKVHKMKGGS